MTHDMTHDKAYNKYDRIGVGYNNARRPDPRIQAAIDAALGDARRIVNVGAGAGSYEPPGRNVIAVEPSAEMISQRAPGSHGAVRGTAERLPFGADAFDAAMALLTIHHWRDVELGLREMRRVTRGPVIVFTWDQPVCETFWLIQEYFPEIIDIDRRRAVAISDIEAVLGCVELRTVPVPHDCADGFLGAYWRRPEAYLDRGARAAISSFAVMDPVPLSLGLAKLEADLGSGEWLSRHGHLMEMQSIDLGYRLVVASALPSGKNPADRS